MPKESAESSEHMGPMPKKVDLKVKHVVLVLSGKGGVGKTTVAVNLAVALATHGYRTGLLDLDIHGPDVPKMLGLEGAKLVAYEKAGIEPVRARENLSVVSMEFLLESPSSAVIWRGPMKMGAIRQFLEDVHWGDLDFLVVDLPPGTGDEVLTIAQIAPHISGVVVVTTPQEVSILDITKAVHFDRFQQRPRYPRPGDHREHERPDLSSLRKDDRPVRVGRGETGCSKAQRPVPGLDPPGPGDEQGRRRGEALYPRIGEGRRASSRKGKALRDHGKPGENCRGRYEGTITIAKNPGISRATGCLSIAIAREEPCPRAPGSAPLPGPASPSHAGVSARCCTRDNASRRLRSP